MTNRICVIRVDGGICSQLAFVAYGMRISQPGETVKYDLQWYEDCGTDDLGEQVRIWDVPKLLPSLKIDIATKGEIDLAKAGRKGYRYIDGCPNRMPALLEYADSFKAMMNPALDSASQTFLDQIREVQSCAIHVRRGDLADGHVGYGKPTPIEYFKNAILFERARTSGKANFFVFSDDTEWTKANIMSLLGGGGARLCMNGSDKGYVDLYLMAHCDSIISSIGSLGDFAAVLSLKRPTLYLSYFKESALSVENSIYINPYMPQQYLNAMALKSQQGRRTGLCKIRYKLSRHFEKLVQKFKA